MAKKPTVTTLQSGFNSTETLNANFEALRDGFDNTLSLDGSTPNAMEADLDLNGNKILNATAIIVGGSDVIATTAAALAAATQAQVDADAAVVASALSETNAANSATASQTSANASQASRLAAELAETNAETAETNAKTAETNSETSATNSAASALAALGSQNAASSSAAAALASQVDANTSQGNASVSALAASNSETAAALSESNAATSETNAATSETNAATSETNAANSETAAAASETAAATSETNAATSETNAAVSETNAAASETEATAQAVIAANEAAAAAASAASVVTDEAATAAFAAASASSAVESANSAASAAAALDNFDDRYLGPKSSEPTLDNDGDALVSGALYFSTTSNAMQVYDGANWVSASAAGVASMNLYEYTATAGQTTFTGSDDNGNSISFIQGNEIVVLNGIILDPSDYNSTSGTSIVLNVAAAVGDLLNVYAFKSFTVADTVSASTGGTFGGNVTVTGTLAAATLTGDGSQLTGLPAGYTDTDVATYLAGTSPTVGGLTTTADVSFGDNDKALFGAGSDLQIYHDGSHSIINDVGTGHLKLQGTDVRIQSSNGAENFLVADEDGAVRLYNDNSQKFQTTSTGIDVTGTVTADGLTVDGASAIELVSDKTVTTPHTDYNLLLDNGSDTEFVIRLDSVNSGSIGSSHIKQISEGTNRGALVFATENGSGGTVPDRLKVDYNGDISFYEDTGTTPKFFWDASAERLGIGTSSPDEALEIDGGNMKFTNTVSNDSRIYFTHSTSANRRSYIGALETSGNGNSLIFAPNANGFDAAEAMRIDSSGNLLVGTTEAYPGAGVAENRAGVSVEDTYGIHASADGERSLLLNRMNSDGTIVDLRKDGSTVGSIGTEGSHIYVGSNDVALRFRDAADQIQPYSTSGVARDAAIDLGAAGTRFKDGHFSGTVNATSFSGDGSALTGVGGSTTAGAVGTYAYLLHKTRDIGIIQGSTYAGSSMVYSGQSTNSLTSASGYSVGHGLGCATASGTWRAMGSRGSTTGYDYFATLFVRIS